jgi:hypothetical protein
MIRELINVNYQGGLATEKAWKRVNYIVVRLNVICANGTAVAGVNVTDAAIRLIVPVASKERVPVASQYGAVFAITVREGCCAIAVQGDGLLIIRMFKCLVSCQGYSAKTVTSLLPQLTVLH